MPKTNETKKLENALRQDMYQKRLYGCEEVTIGCWKIDIFGEIAVLY